MSKRKKDKKKRVTIMGLGGYDNGSGISSALFFAKQGYNVLITDLKTKKELKVQVKKLKKFKNVSFVLGRHRKKDFIDTDVIFQNPSVPDTSPYIILAKKQGIPIINDWNIFLKNHNNFLIGVTGTKGKSTTTSLIYKMIKANNKNVLLCGNIGVSPLKYIGLKPEPPMVAELSSWLLRGFNPIKKSPKIAILTNLSADHLDKYPSLKVYYRDKENIFRFQKPDDYLILNKDDAEARKWADKTKSHVYWFSKKLFKHGNGVYVKGKSIYFKKNNKVIKVCSVSDVKMMGEHNLENALAAIVASLVYGLSVRKIKTVLRKFKGIPHRLEFIRRINGVRYYNDTTATNPSGVIAALRTFKNKQGRIILIAGGHDKNLDYIQLVKEINKTVKALILFKGTATDKIFSCLNRRSDLRYPVVIVSSMKHALESVEKFIKKGDIVLLSPGAASFGIFKNEFDRGNQFIKLVKKI